MTQKRTETGSDRESPHRGALINRRFEILERLGSGGQGLVFRVRDLAQGGRVCVLKAPHHSTSGDALERLRWEFMRLARLDHGRLLRVFELDRLEAPAAGLPAGQIFFTAEYLAGPRPADLMTQLDSAGRSDLLWRLATDVASALDHIHAHGLLHGDVTPDNLRCTPEGDIKLLDLGLSVTRARAARAGQVSGTLPYLAPEALAGCPEARSDLYGLGATLYALAAGRPPRDVPQDLPLGAQIRRLLDTPVEPLDSRASRLPVTLLRLVDRLLRPDPEDRPPSAAAVLDSIARHRRTVSLALARGGRALPLLAPGLVGRARTLDELTTLFSRRFSPETPLEGPPVVAVLTGPEGVGRTAVMQEVARRLQIAAARGQTASFVLGQGSTLAAAAAAALGHPPEPLRDAVSSLRLLEALERRSAERPVLLLVSGLGADADPGADPLSQALRDPHLQLARVGILVRAGLDEEPAWDAMASLTRTLPPLDAPALAELVARSVGKAPPDAYVSELRQQSGGLPGVARAMLLEAWSRVRDRNQVLDVPLSTLAGEGLVDLARRQIERLSPQASALAEAVAASPVPVPLAWAADAAGLSETDAVAAVEQLTADAFLQTADGQVALGQERLRRLLLERLQGQPDRFRQVHETLAQRHRAAADAEDERSCLAEVHHRRQLGPSARLAELTRRAARRALARGEWRRAADLLSEALEALRPEGSQEDAVPSAEAREDRLALRLQLAEARIRAGDYEAGRRALAPIRATPGSAEALRATTLCALSLQREGRVSEALSAILPALREPAPEDASLARWHAEALAVWVRIQTARGDFPAVWQSISADGPMPEGPGTLAVLEAVGLAAYHAGRIPQARRWFAEAVTRARTGSDPLALARALGCDGMTRQAQGDLMGARDRYAEALRISEQAGDLHGAAHFAANLGAILREMGRLAEALEPSVQAVRRMARLGYAAAWPLALYNLGNLLLSLGDLPGVAREARLLHEIASPADQADRLAAYRDLLAAELGRRCRQVSSPLPEALPDPLRDPPSILAARAADAFARSGSPREALFARIAEIEALVAEGQVPRARERWQDLAAEMQDTEDPLLEAHLAMAEGRLSLAGGREPTRCLERLSRATGYLEESGQAELAWRCATLCAALAIRAGQRDLAKPALRTAQALEREQRALLGDFAGPARTGDPDARRLARLRGALEPQARRGGPAEPPASEEAPRRLLRLLDINKRINTELRLPILLELVLDAAVELTDAERGFVLLSDGDGNLEIQVARNLEGQALPEAERALSLSIAEEATARGKAVVTVDAASDERFSQAVSVHGLRLRSVLAVPLRVKGRVVGAVYLDNRLRRGAFAPEDVSVVEDFADQAAIAIDNARLHAELAARAEQIEALNAQLAEQVAAQAEELADVRAALAESRAALAVRYDYSNIVGQSAQMLDLFRLLDRVTDAEVPVVVYGESGTGKELVARAIHFNGPRRDRPFVSENCGALPETLLESILFGHVKGAFTGAHRDRKGLFEVADGGTLFLDEVGEMSPAMQTKLLRVLQSGEFRRVGGDAVVRVRVRVIAATNRPLEQLVAEGRFRQDLYYRLNVLTVSLPPLRERPEDIPLLVQHFLDRYSPDRPRRVSREAMRLLVAYPWPGNVRELENEVQRMLALGGDLLGRDDLSDAVRGAPPRSEAPAGLDLRDHVAALERRLIRRALDQTRGNQTRAAALLGLSRYGLLKKLRRYGMVACSEQRPAIKDG